MISVIIPTLNEEAHLNRLLCQLKSYPIISEIIVSDGGSKDATQRIAEAHQVRFIQGSKGRGVQMNIGAKHAEYDTLLFLHADSSLERISQDLMAEITKYEVGSFCLTFDCQSLWLKIYAFFSRINSTVFTYGDQGLFIKRDLFNQIEGFKEILICEDIDLVRRVKKQTQFVKFQTPVITSSRRFETGGVVLQQLKNIVIVLLFLMGVKPSTLAKYYTYSL